MLLGFFGHFQMGHLGPDFRRSERYLEGWSMGRDATRGPREEFPR